MNTKHYSGYNDCTPCHFFFLTAFLAGYRGYFCRLIFFQFAPVYIYAINEKNGIVAQLSDHSFWVLSHCDKRT
jgi:hypothetical protein